MSRLNSESKVGLTVLAGIAILTYMAFTVGDYRIGKQEGYSIHAIFDSVAGVSVKTSVVIAGVPIGEVERIELIETQARVTLRIRPEVKIRREARAVIRSTGMLGEKYIEIIFPETRSPGDQEGTLFPGDLSFREPASRDWKAVQWLGDFLIPAAHADEVSAPAAPDEAGSFLKEGEVIHQEGKSADVQRLIEEINTIADDLREVSHTLKAVLGSPESQEALQNIVHNIQEFAQNLNTTLQKDEGDLAHILSDLRVFSGNLKQLSEQAGSQEGTLGKLFHDQELYPRLDQITRDLERASHKIRKGEGTVGKLIQDDELYSRLTAAAADMQEIFGKIRKGEGTLGKLVFEEETYDNLNDTIKNLNYTLNQFTGLEIFLSFRTEYQSGPEDYKGYFSLMLQPRDHKYYLIEVVDDPRAEVTKTIVFNEDGDEVETLEAQRKLRFSAQIARRFGDFWFRGGLVESTFGIASDVFLLNDQLKLSLDLWDFNSEDPAMENPRLKLSAAVPLMKYFWIHGGLDNALNQELKTGFFGAAIRFRDDDLKYILSSAAIALN